MQQNWHYLIDKDKIFSYFFQKSGIYFTFVSFKNNFSNF